MLDSRLYRLVILRLAHLAGDAKAGQDLGEVQVGRAVRVSHGDGALRRAEQGQESGADGCHPGGEAGGAFGPFQGGHLLFKAACGGVGIAAVDVSWSLTQRHGAPGVEIVEGVSSVLDDGG